ncbi:MAG TPA: HAMP domain-containing sensor histidine kinase [Candidatus Limnocylindrales bacterium]|nr:HAMP domain-containing sensor histidine kinase [Candidatus Limnocylindrales bacterium]
MSATPSPARRVLGGLRSRLFLSYVTMLMLTIGVVLAALLVLLATRPAPLDQTYRRLAPVALSVDYRRLLVGTRLGIISLQEALQGLADGLRQVAAERGVRILLIKAPEQLVLYDSSGVLAAGTVFPGTLTPYTIPSTLLRGAFADQIEAVAGTAQLDGKEWRYLGVSAFALRGENVYTVFAEQSEPQSFRQSLNDYLPELGPVLLQALCVGLLAALALSALISRGIARPLQDVARAAGAVAAGQDDQRAPVAGPSEVRAVATAFNQMSDKVQAEQRAQQDFLANVSHDLKTPLTSIQGYSQAIIDGAAANPVGAARIIYDEAARLNRLVMQLTDLARLQSGRFSMTLRPINLAQISDAIGQRLSIVAREKGVELHILSAPVPLVQGDGDRLAQVLTNLISNALQYTPAGGSVTVRTAPNEGGVVIAISDTGAGIPAEELPRIFERFYQVDKARGPRRGSGLGLAIVAEIVHAHGGTISASSAGAGAGATFTVWLPLVQTGALQQRKR